MIEAAALKPKLKPKLSWSFMGRWAVFLLAATWVYVPAFADWVKDIAPYLLKSLVLGLGLIWVFFPKVLTISPDQNVLDSIQRSETGEPL